MWRKVVAHTGLEPVISALRGQRVNQLHQCAAPGIIGAGVARSQVRGICRSLATCHGNIQALHWDRRRLACKVVTKHVSSVPIRLFTRIAGVSPARLLQNTSRRFQSGSYHDDFAGETPAVPVKSTAFNPKGATEGLRGLKVLYCPRLNAP